MNPATLPAPAANWFRHALSVLFVVSFVLYLPLSGTGQEKTGAEGLAKKKAPSGSGATTVIVRFTNDRIVKFGMGGEHIRLTTPYGKLLIPIAKIRSIDFATRITDADARRAAAAVAKLGSSQFRVRRAAEAELLKLGAKAATALHDAFRSKDVEVVLRAKTLLTRLGQRVSEDQLEIRPDDVVRTTESRIVGRIEGTGLKVHPFPLDKEPRKLLPLDGLRSLAIGIDPRAINAPSDPGNLQAFQQRIGKTFWFKVTGAVTGTIWGTKVYTSDSPLATTAVHAGILKVGQKGVVQVKIVAPPANYAGSTKNGVVSNPYGAWPGAYEFIR
jgi:hypothetical protein